LLRVIQEREIMRVGGNKIISVDVRIIAATNENLEDLVSNGVFRSDLYYRLNTLPIQIPSLKDRGGDIMILFEEIKKELNGQFTLSPQVEKAFMAHNWDGNVRELRIYVEYFTYLDKYYVEHDDLPISFHKGLNTKKDTYENDLDVNLLKKIAGNKLDDYCFILKTLH
ncbi:MAG: sigma-54-dependent Fis family transcriptional regulator, partial [Tissierellia bacterium]|nr:sigma-54-dependent Fis family transcriptional regulator [Tissierellia bacterium]